MSTSLPTWTVSTAQELLNEGWERCILKPELCPCPMHVDQQDDSVIATGMQAARNPKFADSETSSNQAYDARHIQCYIAALPKAIGDLRGDSACPLEPTTDGRGCCESSINNPTELGYYILPDGITNQTKCLRTGAFLLGYSDVNSYQEMELEQEGSQRKHTHFASQYTCLPVHGIAFFRKKGEDGEYVYLSDKATFPLDGSWTEKSHSGEAVDSSLKSDTTNLECRFELLKTFDVPRSTQINDPLKAIRLPILNSAHATAPELTNQQIIEKIAIREQELALAEFARRIMGGKTGELGDIAKLLREVSI